MTKEKNKKPNPYEIQYRNFKKSFDDILLHPLLGKDYYNYFLVYNVIQSVAGM